MESLLAKRLKAIEEEQRKYRSRLKKLDPQLRLNGILSGMHEIPFQAAYFKAQEQVQVEDMKLGAMMRSSLGKDEFKYMYYVHNQEIENLLRRFQEGGDHFFTLSCPGFFTSTCFAELYLIFDTKSGERVNQKVQIGKSLSFRLSQPENIAALRIAVRVKGGGQVYAQSPRLIVQEPRTVLPYAQKKQRQAKPISELNVLFIADEFTTRSFAPEFQLIQITPDDWEETAAAGNPDLFFCESAWLGNDGAWQNKVGTGGPRDNSTLIELVVWCKERGIPTVFWNKEDPFHYNAFIETAKHFDYVFTTDASSIARYQADGCKQVYAMPFAAQPLYHNPIEKFERKHKVVFAGAYYGDKFPERKKAMDHMIEISGRHGIDIYDRNYNNPASPNQFPEAFKQYILGTLKGDEIEIAYKGYRIALNVNSIVDSPTMFSRRVFELLACNTPVVSSESLGMKNMFGNLVVASADYEELKGRINRYFEDEGFYLRNRLDTLRLILEKHTYRNRIEDMLKSMSYPFVKEDRSVTVVGIVRSRAEYEQLMEQFERQEHVSKKLVILLDLFDGYLELFNANNNKIVKTYLLDYIHHYVSIGDIIETKYFAPMRQGHYYGKNYLRDLALATQYTKDAVIVKNQDKEYTYTTEGELDKALIPKSTTKLLKPMEFVQLLLSEHRSISDWFRRGTQLFNVNDHNFIPREQLQGNVRGLIEKTEI